MVDLEYCLQHYKMLPTTTHLLNTRWTFFINIVQANVDWKDSIKEIKTVDSLEEFWRLYANIKNVEELVQTIPKFDFSLFRDGIEPMAESEANRKGGRFILTLEKSSVTEVDSLWLTSMLFLICEGTEQMSEFNGAALAIKPRSFKLSFWTRTCEKRTISVLRDIINSNLPELNPFIMSFCEHRSY